MLSCFYIDNAHYQENILPKLHKDQGHDVLIIASTDVFVKNNILGSTTPGTYLNENNIPVIRVPYAQFLHPFLEKKIRKYIGVYKLIEDFKPDIILFHGGAAYEIKTVARYKKKNPNVKMFIDSHEDLLNSAQNFLSKHVLHRLFYKPILLRNLKYFEEVLYISKDTHYFLNHFYNIPETKLKFFPLGGIIPDRETKLKTATKIRKELSIEDNQLLCLHTGKLDKLKRTEEILEGFHQSSSDLYKLVIIGSIDDDFKPILDQYLEKDSRIVFLGWKKAIELQDYLMACDLYLQLGSQSATMQLAVCSGAVTAVYPHESYKFLMKTACFYINSANDITKLLNSINEDPAILEEKRVASRKVAEETLDYDKIAKMIL